MNSIQVLAYEYRRTSGGRRDYVKQQIDLHLFVLAELRKTYWTADVHHSLLRTCIESLEKDAGTFNLGPPPAQESNRGDNVLSPIRRQQRDDSSASEQVEPEDIIAKANPFVGLPSYIDELG